MDTPYRLQVHARRAEFPALAGLVETACATSPTEHRLRLLLLVEELFCNSLEHGYGAECGQPIGLALQPDGEGCRVLYWDHAPAFDPFAEREAPELTADIDLRPVGGLGLLLLARYASWRRYRRQEGSNLVEFFLPDRPADAGQAIRPD